jgi:hypothetical protein
MENITNIIKIQSLIKTFLAKKKYRRMLCEHIIKILGRNDELMKKCYVEILNILKKFPPAKDINKFIYGILVQKALTKTLSKIFNCIDLDKTHKVGGEYKFDISLSNQKFSIKASKNTNSCLTLINKLNIDNHNIFNVNFLVCYIEKGELYFFPSFEIDHSFMKETGSRIIYKSSIYNKYLKNSKYKYVFPKLLKTESDEIKQLEEIDIYETIYNQFISKD